MASVNMPQTSAGSGGVNSGPTPWWQTPGQGTKQQNLIDSAPPGYYYDSVQMRYAPIIGSPTDALAQRAKLESMFGQLLGGGGSFGTGGGGGAPVPYPSGGGGSVPQIPTPAGITLDQIPNVALPDDSAAQAANFARSKDQIGQETSGGLTALRSALAARGLLGGGAEVKGTSNVLTRGQGELGDTTRENMTNEAHRIDDFAKLGYQGAIEQRGQNVSLLSGNADRSLNAATTNYTGGVNQRGQDISAANAQYQGGVTQRGQDVTARGQNLSMFSPLATLLTKLY